ncbi:MAG: restriction endonuclease subunit S [Veillonella sp.]|nr:restriction endonuclease subunit S [Veillonella sp.]
MNFYYPLNSITKVITYILLNKIIESIESEFVDGGTYKVINIGSYSEESVYNDQGLRVNKTDKTKSRILNKYDLTMILNDKTASGNIIGRVLLIDQDNTYVYNQRTERIEVDTKDFLPMFLYHMLNAPEQRKYIVKAISNIDYMIPQLLLEQEKIANLFSLINKDITLHQ